MTPGKRFFDIALALLLLPLFLPLMGTIAIALLAAQGRPVLYASERMRDPSRAFNLWKFRTMRPAPVDSGVSGGDKNARITPTGKLLRRSRLDELPQIFNILAGDMSFVGPRPPLRQYVDAFPETYSAVLKSRPGVTGLASLLYHRHEERVLAPCASAEETNRVYSRRCIPVKARLDLIYQRNQGICFDIAILARTLASVANRS
ncbi:UDP-N-acetylgalactosamine-undecaprenyl-phosphate N-acetylgalactosaminephosphotransferase [Defluviimonas aquaemixtae]|uniref:UDP-N-acetylgalactosamine-undecaprenyl-phosphate N-acetylgalactosaminephosphotransferase n=1 Tax=Albidovulum aquaemixtae TaxID=1542388 RepID=A0A2R8B2S0_9RHOB|nr:sugar transferase [Defluviimonas aquaemixtae]SPH16875.1 UDP-N-acetylgalactosamine-undecaprenyl-phosphate N-acetylgalactosaminephosphotransferase [Defluviimonas aquaemixtae]